MNCRTNTLTINDVEVNQDANGRYCLNDLHKAAGLEARHQPSNFLRSEMAQGLIAAFGNSSEVRSLPVESMAGRGGGTYACRPLVYAYAAWISPEFHLKVFEVFDAVVTGQVQSEQAPPAAPVMALPAGTPGSIQDTVAGIVFLGNAMASVTGLTEGIRWATTLEAVTRQTGISTDGFARLLPAQTDPGRLNPSEVGAPLGLTAAQVNDQLEALGHQTYTRKEKPGGKKGPKEWVLTESGAEFGEMVPFRAPNGHTKHRPLWRPKVRDILKGRH